MRKQWVNWKLVSCKSRLGKDIYVEIPTMIDRRYRGTLLARILDMPKQKPLGFDDAIRMIKQKYFSSKIGHEPGQNFWYFANFVEWMTSEGFHIELTGDEFEDSYGPQQMV